MNNGRAFGLTVAASLSLFGIASCSSSADEPAAGAGASSSAGTGGGDSGSGASSNGGSGAVGNGGSGATAGTTDMGSVDPSCNTTLAKTGAPCTKDCVIECGFNGMGTKTCTCMSGVYTMCPCLKPAEYLGAPTAPYCPGDGMTTALKDMPCETEWDQCIGKDGVSGSTPKGCVCMKDAANGDALTWFCGSTNKWFALAQ